MLHLDLFSGIGGFALAAERVWPDIKHIFCDNEPFAQAILKKHWPEAPIFGDIRTLRLDSYPDGDGRPRGSKKIYPAEAGEQALHDAPRRAARLGRTTTNAGSPELGGLSGSQRQAVSATRKSGVFLLTGGFPCQPFSQAGRRKGTEDDRFLWPEMLRVIREFKPRWIIGENVAGLLSMVQYKSGLEVEAAEYTSEEDARTRLEEMRREGQGRRSGQGILSTIMEQLDQLGYEVQPFVIPAVAVNAPHRRDRVWIVAHAKSDDAGGKLRDISSENGKEPRSEKQGENEAAGVSNGNSYAPDTGQPHGAWNNEGVEADKTIRTFSKFSPERSNSWNEDWLEAATRLCAMDDGLRRNVVGSDGSRDAETKPHPKGWRNAALKGAGNAIVPQVAEQIFKAIKAVDDVL